MRSSEFVRVRDCTCPDTPHEEGDGVYLTPTLSAEGGITAEQQMTEIGNSKAPDWLNTLTQKWLITFVRYGAQGWNFQNEDGDVPFDVEELLADWTLARPVALRAGELYQASVATPLTPAPAKPSRNGRTAATTSRRRSPTPASSG